MIDILFNDIVVYNHEMDGIMDGIMDCIMDGIMDGTMDGIISELLIISSLLIIIEYCCYSY